ncbi:hypothetical protein HanPSC8_Chr11g0458291 [Helianthus annuus]|nr:hypothetical protein HanPSC8_Chr11g0458291 [Helianthus annuus]
MFLHFRIFESVNKTVGIYTNWELSDTSKPPVILYSFWRTLESHYTSTRTHKVSCVIIRMKPI